jgi:ABC-type glycerol-3-phosphate transport system substrate-binding protein
MKKLAIIFASLGVVGLAACGPVQSDSCAQYITCQEAIDEADGTSTADSLDSAYGATGTCWSSTAEAADACTTACDNALDAFETAYPDLDDCAAPAA